MTSTIIQMIFHTGEINELMEMDQKMVKGFQLNDSYRKVVKPIGTRSVFLSITTNFPSYTTEKNLNNQIQF